MDDDLQHDPAAGIPQARHDRNFGQDNAIMTGLRYARGRAVAIMDEVASQIDADDVGIIPAERPDDVPRAIGRPVVDQYDLVLEAAGGEGPGDLGHERLETL